LVSHGEGFQWTDRELIGGVCLLVVSREKDQSMMIGDDLRVTVLRVRGKRALVVAARRRLTVRQPSWEESEPKWMEVGEEVELGRDAWVGVVDVRGEKVRLGFTLPKHLQLHRQEVYDALHALR